MIRIILIFLFFVLACISCEEKIAGPYHFASDHRYYPVNKGNTKIYQVQEIIIDKPSGVTDTINFQQKEVINGEITDINGNRWQKTEVYKRSTDGLSWKFDHVYTIMRSTYEAQWLEDNIKRVKLIFPLKLYNSWDGNRYNQEDTLKIHRYIVTKLHEPYTIGDLFFDSTLHVSQKADSSLIHKDIAFEKYAAGIGLILKKEIYLVSDEPDFDPTVPIEQRITTAYIYTRTIISYGDR